MVEQDLRIGRRASNPVQEIRGILPKEVYVLYLKKDEN